MTVTQLTSDLDTQIDAVLCEVTEKQTALTSAVDEKFSAVVAKLQQQHHEQAQGLARTNDKMERHLNEMRDSFASSLAQQHAHISHLQEKQGQFEHTLLKDDAKSSRQLHGATQVCIRRVEEHRIELGRVTTQMDSLEGRLDIIQPIVNETRRRAQECEMSVAPMGNQLQDVDRRVNVLGTQVTTIGQQVHEVTQRVTTMASQMVGVDNIKNEIARSHTGNAGPQVSVLGEQVGDTLSKLQTLELRTTVCSQHVTTLLTNYGEMETRIGTMGSQMAGLQQNVASIDTIKLTWTSSQRMLERCKVP